MAIGRLREISRVEIELGKKRYRDPLRLICSGRRHVSDHSAGQHAPHPKNVEPLVEVLGQNLYFLLEFIGRGDMSGGALLLRSIRSNNELAYVSIEHRNSDRAASRRALARGMGSRSGLVGREDTF